MSRDKKYVAVIQAGGKGTRLREISGNSIPKPLVKIAEKSMLEWQIENLKKSGINSIYIICGYLGHKITEFLGSGSRFGVDIRYIQENEPLGSAGALYYLKKKEISACFLLVFGDIMFDVDFKRAIQFHENKNSDITLFLHPNGHPNDSDVILVNENDQVTGVLKKNVPRSMYYDNLVNAGIYIINSKVLENLKNPINQDLEKDIVWPFIKTGAVYGYRTTEYIKDAGTPERFYKVEEEQKLGIWKQRRLSSPQRCIFLDRDGTINVHKGLLYHPDQLELEMGAAEAIRIINESGYLAILITNQPVIARGLCNIEDLKNIHKKLSGLLGEQGAYLDDIIVCPHHPDKGFQGENKKYKIKCNCRKPSIGMIEKMVKKYNIDIAQSYIIGDSTTDIMTGKNAGMTTILVETGESGKDGKYRVNPDYVARNLLEAVQYIIKK